MHYRLYVLPIAKLEVTPSVAQCSVFYYLRNLTNAFVCKKKRKSTALTEDQAQWHSMSKTM